MTPSQPTLATAPSPAGSNPTGKRPWLRWLALAVLVALLALGVGRALHKRQLAQTEAQAAAKRLQAPVVFALAAADTVLATERKLVQLVNISGTLRATRTALVKAKVAGELMDLAVREGDFVQAGQVLARIDTTEFRARLEQADQQAQAAAAQLTIAQRTQDNNQALVRQGFISATALDTSRANLEAAQSNHKAALAAAQVARKALEDTAVRSPISGQVASRSVQNGERVGVDARILELVDLRELEVEAALPPADATRVQVGQMAQLQIEGFAEPVEAKVARIGPAAQVGSRSVLVYLRVQARSGLRHGLFVNGSVQVGTTQGVAVPTSAIRNDRPQPYVQWLKPMPDPSGDGQAEVVHQTVRELARGIPVDASAAQGTWAVVEGIANNSMVASVGSGFYQEKTRIQVQPSTEAPTGR